MLVALRHSRHHQPACSLARGQQVQPLGGLGAGVHIPCHLHAVMSVARCIGGVRTPAAAGSALSQVGRTLLIARRVRIPFSSRILSCGTLPVLCAMHPAIAVYDDGYESTQFGIMVSHVACVASIVSRNNGMAAMGTWDARGDIVIGPHASTWNKRKTVRTESIIKSASQWDDR